MKKSSALLFWLLIGVFSFFPITVSEILAACFPDLPAPTLQFKGTENYEVGGNEFRRYRLAVENLSDYPEELFTPAPQLPPCGLNPNSSRTWIDIVDDQNKRIYGFCALSRDGLDKIWFAKPRGEAPPPQVHIKFKDRACNQTYTSNGVSPTPVQVRQNIKVFAQDANKLAALRKGIEVMKTRAATDPTSWTYQGNIHGNPGTDGPAQPSWNSCQHGSWYFLAWHRMYLYYFERILRTASGDPTLTLPYWNYSDSNDSNARQIPLPYRQPADSVANPLYISNRSSIMNAGGNLPQSSVDIEQALQLAIFSSPAGNSQSFGGQRSGPGHSLNPHSVFEGTPHDVVHVNIGGWMGSFERAARDPVFWLHHANIDRLWEVWLREENSHANPISGQGDPWLNQTFTFFDENGTTVTMTGSQIVDTVKQLNYRYDDQMPSRRRPLRRLEIPRVERPRIFAMAEPKQLIKKKLESFVLKGESRSVTIRLPEESETLRQGDLILRLDQVKVQSFPTGHYEVYVNLPENENPNYKSPFYVGNMSFFGSTKSKEVSRSFRFLLSTIEKKLRTENRWTKEIKVTFFKTGPEPPPGENVNQQTEEQGVIQIGEVNINRE